MMYWEFYKWVENTLDYSLEGKWENSYIFASMVLRKLGYSTYLVCQLSDQMENMLKKEVSGNRKSDTIRIMEMLKKHWAVAFIMGEKL